MWIAEIHMKCQALLSLKNNNIKVAAAAVISTLTLSNLSKKFSRRHFEIFFLSFPENRLWHLMQTVSLGDSLHEMSKPIWLEK